MNILYIPQLSMYNKQTGELIPQADGNFNMMKNTLNEWYKYRKNDVFYVLLPSEIKEKWENYFNIKPKLIPIYYDSYVVSARINRFNFPYNDIVKKIDFNIDLIITDVIEIATNLKQMLKISFDSSPKIISNIRHIDEEINYLYIYRVIDGIINSNLTTILSESMWNNIYNQLKLLVPKFKIHEIINKVHVFEPSVSKDEIDKFIKYNPRNENGKPIITFPGRLSVGEEKRTNWDKFIKAIKMLREERNDFEVYLTDPNNSYRGKLDWIKTIPRDRNRFLDLLNNTDIIVSLMSIEGFGGISIREALLFDCYPVIPYVDEYKKMAPNNFLGFVDMPVTVKGIKNALYHALDNYKKFEDMIKPYGYQFSVESQFKNILPKIENIMEGI